MRQQFGVCGVLNNEPPGNMGRQGAVRGEME